MPDLFAFDYAIIRLVPRVERQEFINVGVILSCPGCSFLKSRVELDSARLNAFAPGGDCSLIEAYLVALETVCIGGRHAGPIGQMPQRARFHWLVAPRSTIIQTSPVHVGLCTDPATMLDHLFNTMVALPFDDKQRYK
jgi:hypothetical protein